MKTNKNNLARIALTDLTEDDLAGIAGGSGAHDGSAATVPREGVPDAVRKFRDLASLAAQELSGVSGGSGGT